MQHIGYICSSSTLSFFSPANSTPCFMLVRHFPLLQPQILLLKLLALTYALKTICGVLCPRTQRKRAMGRNMRHFGLTTLVC